MKDLDLTLRAFYYLSIQLYITSAFYSSMYNSSGLCKLFRLLEDNMAEREWMWIVWMVLRIFHFIIMHRTWCCVWKILYQSWSSVFNALLGLFDIEHHDTGNYGHSIGFIDTSKLFHIRWNDARSMDYSILFCVRWISLNQTNFKQEIDL